MKRELGLFFLEGGFGRGFGSKTVLKSTADSASLRSKVKFTSFKRKENKLITWQSILDRSARAIWLWWSVSLCATLRCLNHLWLWFHADYCCCSCLDVTNVDWSYTKKHRIVNRSRWHLLLLWLLFCGGATNTGITIIISLTNNN